MQVKGYNLSQLVGDMNKSIVGFSDASTLVQGSNTDQYISGNVLKYPYKTRIFPQRWSATPPCPECHQVNVRRQNSDIITCVRCSIDYCYNCLELLSTSLKKSHLQGGLCLKERCWHWRHGTDCPCVTKVLYGSSVFNVMCSATWY